MYFINFQIIIKIAQNINIFFLNNIKMTLLNQTVAIIALIFKLCFSGITNLEFNFVSSISNPSYNFSQLTITKVYENYLYISQANHIIRKINLISMVQQGAFEWATEEIVKDFVVYANGTKMVASYSSDTLVQWNASSITYLYHNAGVCNNIFFLDDVSRFICSIYASQNLEMRRTDFSYVSSVPFSQQDGNLKFCLSSDKKIFIGINNLLNYSIVNFSYTNSLITYSSILSSQAIGASYNRKIYTAQNVPFTFYLVNQMQIIQLNVLSNTVNYYYHNVLNTIKAFKQIANDRVAYVMLNSNTSVNFIGKGDFNFSQTFLIASGIQDISISADKKKLILILQAQIQIYQFACTNSQYYDPTIFDCMSCPAACLSCYTNSPNCSSCLPGLFLNNQTCSACDVSCQTCENSTGCLTCADNLEQIQIGLLCQNLKIPSAYVNNSTASSQILEGIMYFTNIPSALKIPLQSSFLVLIADFWIYNYHNRTYGKKVNQVFQMIQIIENHKWALAKFDKYLNITLNPHYLGFSNYSNYSNPKFLEIENKSSTFFESLKQYFLYFTPTVILIFLLYRFIFYKTFDYRVSRHFRKYSFNLFIVFLLTQGNFEYLCYCCFNQSQMLYFFNFFDKINAQLCLLFFFLATIHAFGTFYITYWFYPRLGGKFIDETKKMLPSFTMYTVMTNGKNFILAAIQSFLFNFYVTQMFATLGVHLLLIGIMLYFQIKYGIFKRAIFFNFLLLQSAIKILVNFFLLIQYFVKEDDNSTFDVLEDCLMLALYIWGIVIVFGIISSFFPQTKKIQRLEARNENKKQEKTQQCKNLSGQINNSAEEAKSKSKKCFKVKQEETEQRYNLSDEINNSAEKRKSNPTKGLKSIKQKFKEMKEKLKKSIRFENRFDVEIIEYQNKPIKLRNKRQKQTKKQKMQFSLKINNQSKIPAKGENNQQKNHIHNQRKDQGSIFMVKNCNQKVSSNKIQQIRLSTILQTNQ